MLTSPFIYGKTVNPPNFFNRRKTIQRLLGRILTNQSSAVVGDPHSGKSSLLLFLKDFDNWNSMFPSLPGNFSQKFLFSYINCQALSGNQDQAYFWSHVLKEVKDKNREIEEAYRKVELQAFTTPGLESFFCLLSREGYNLVILMDEVDTLLNHPSLNDAGFYGCLRHLTSLVEGISLIAASCCCIETLNRKTQTINPHGSPYFNTLTEYWLGPLPEEDAGKLLDRGDGIFSQDDRNYIHFISGGHPYLTQLSAAVLWETEKNEQRYENAAEEICRLTESHFSSIWRNLTDSEKKVIAAIALNQIPRMIKGKNFKHQKLIKQISDYNAELRCLKNRGILKKEEDEWNITQTAFLWWIGDEIKRTTRDSEEFKNWIINQEFEGLLTKEDKTKWKKATALAGELFKNGAGEFIKHMVQTI